MTVTQERAAQLTGDAEAQGHGSLGDEILDATRRVPNLWFGDADEHGTPRRRFHLEVGIAPQVAEQRVAAWSALPPRRLAGPGTDYPRGSSASPATDRGAEWSLRSTPGIAGCNDAGSAAQLRRRSRASADGDPGSAR